MSDLGVSRAHAAVWPGVSRLVRDRALAVLGDDTGLDGHAAAGAIAHALRVDGSPWAAAVDSAMRRALHEMVVEPIARALRAVAEVVARWTAAIREGLAALAQALRDADVVLPSSPAWTDVCRCLCGLHRLSPGVCLGEVPSGSLVEFTFPGPPLTPARRTIRMCGPCAEAQAARFISAKDFNDQCWIPSPWSPLST